MEQEGERLKTVSDENAGIEATWVSEVLERYRAIQGGVVTRIPAYEAMRQARKRIK
jgi:hypothetical protein